MTPEIKALTLVELNRRISALIASDTALREQWVVAETSDLRRSGGHCYMELIEKDAAGLPVARLRAVIWASQFLRLNAKFKDVTGSDLHTDLRIMVRVTVSFHPAYGLSAVISDINPEYTCGELERRRREILARLDAEGVSDMNRTLAVAEPCLRVAVVSARGAAGYGDFINQLFSSRSSIAFKVTLFEAVMQGESAPPSVISALEEIAAKSDDYDCVAILRGGGATGDMAAFDNYDLALNVCCFPLPVIIGIGHDRDRCVLDYIAAVSVKTPTAAAEWLVKRGEESLDRVRRLAADIYRLAGDRLSGAMRQIAYCEGQLPALAESVVSRAMTAVNERYATRIVDSVNKIITRHSDRLDALGQIVGALAPEATLRRGFSITRVGGRALTDAATLADGDEVETILAHGKFKSKVYR